MGYQHCRQAPAAAAQQHTLRQAVCDAVLSCPGVRQAGLLVYYRPRLLMRVQANNNDADGHGHGCASAALPHHVHEHLFHVKYIGPRGVNNGSMMIIIL